MVIERLSAVLFDVGGVTAAVPLSSVREVLPLPHLSRPPGSPAPFAGFLDRAGAALPAVRLAMLFGLADRAPEIDPLDAHLLVVGHEALTVAFLVDRVLDVVTAGPVTATPVAPDATLNGCVEMEVALRGGLVPLVSADRLLTASERERLASLTRLEAERAARWADA